MIHCYVVLYCLYLTFLGDRKLFLESLDFWSYMCRSKRSQTFHLRNVSQIHHFLLLSKYLDDFWITRWCRHLACDFITTTLYSIVDDNFYHGCEFTSEVLRQEILLLILHFFFIWFENTFLMKSVNKASLLLFHLTIWLSSLDTFL